MIRANNDPFFFFLVKKRGQKLTYEWVSLGKKGENNMIVRFCAVGLTWCVPIVIRSVFSLLKTSFFYLSRFQRPTKLMSFLSAWPFSYNIVIQGKGQFTRGRYFFAHKLWRGMMVITCSQVICNTSLHTSTRTLRKKDFGFEQMLQVALQLRQPHISSVQEFSPVAWIALLH